MVDVAVSWSLSHPLQTVALMACVAVVVAVLLLPALHGEAGQHHPRI